MIINIQFTQPLFWTLSCPLHDKTFRFHINSDSFTNSVIHWPLCPLAHRAARKDFHSSLSQISFWMALHLWPKPLIFVRTVHRHVFLGLPHLCLPSCLQYSAVFKTSLYPPWRHDLSIAILCMMMIQMHSYIGNGPRPENICRSPVWHLSFCI